MLPDLSLVALKHLSRRHLRNEDLFEYPALSKMHLYRPNCVRRFRSYADVLSSCDTRVVFVVGYSVRTVHVEMFK